MLRTTLITGSLLPLVFSCEQREMARQENNRVEVAAHSFTSFSSSKQAIGHYNPSTQAMSIDSTATKECIVSLEYDEFLLIEEATLGKNLLADTVHRRAASDQYPVLSYESNRGCRKKGLLTGKYRLFYSIDRATKTCIIYGVADLLIQVKQKHPYPAVLLYLDE
jgi:hypothetical protein